MTQKIFLALMLCAFLLASCSLQNPIGNNSQSEIPSLSRELEKSSPAPLASPVSQITSTNDFVPTQLPPSVIPPTAEPTAIAASPENITPPPDPQNPSVLAQSLTTHYVVQEGTPVGMSDFIHANPSCNWSGVGGQAFDINGNPVIGLIVEVTGTLNGNNIESLVLTGSSTALGPAGYEIKLADQPVASEGTLVLRLYDLNGQPLSEEISFNTYPDCERSLVLINLVEVPAITQKYLPLISRIITKRWFYPLIMHRNQPGIGR